MNKIIGLQEAAKMLNITVNSLILELKKHDCPYGFACKSGKHMAYFVSRKALEQWINDNPQKYSNHPDYVTRITYKLNRFSTEELLREVKERCIV